MKLPRWILICLVASLALAAVPAFSAEQKEKLKVLFFFSKSCHVCHAVKTVFFPEVLKTFGGRIEIVERDIADMENYQLLLGLRDRHRRSDEIRIPTVVVGESFLVGKEEIASSLNGILDLELANPLVRQTKLVYADLAKHFQSFTPAAVIGAGLVDGINPCAFTVIIFFISFLALQGYARKELVVIGGGFVLAVFLTYLLVGLGLFSVFYGFKSVWVVRRAFNLLIGAATVILGVLSIRDIYRYAKSGEFSDVTLQLPKAVKMKIHRVIGFHYRLPRENGEQPPVKPHLLRLLASAVATGLLVSLLEAVCTGQVYLPTITFVMKTAHFRWEAYGYLVLYNLMFIMPLVVVFMMALFGMTSQDFTRFFRRHFIFTKVLLAGLFFVLGGFLLWKA